MKLRETTGDLCSAVWVGVWACMSEEAEELFILPLYISSLHYMKYLCGAAGGLAGRKWSVCVIAWLVATLQRQKNPKRVRQNGNDAAQRYIHGYVGRSWRHKGRRYLSGSAHLPLLSTPKVWADRGSFNMRLNGQCFWLVAVNRGLNMMMFSGYFRQ